MLRIIVNGDNDTAKAVRGILLQGGFVVTTQLARLELTIEEADIPEPVLDGVDGELERQLLAAIADQSPSGRVLIQRKGGNRSDQVMRIIVPAVDEERVAIETAVLRALHAFVTGKKAQSLNGRSLRSWGLRFARRAR
jgi:hypothetical protein